MSEIPIPTQRLSPKHQVTLPKGARALRGLEGDSYVCGRPDIKHLPGDDTGFRVLVLMSEEELQRREDAIRATEGIDPVTKEQLIITFNGPIHRMSVDAQRRIVLPKHFVDYLGLEREVFMFSTNTTVLAWHPDEWRRWSAATDPSAGAAPVTLPILGV